MAVRSGRNGSAKASAHRLFVPSMLVLVFVTAAALLLYNGSEPVLHPVGISRTQVGSSHLHAYVSQTLRALKQDPLKALVESLFQQARDQIALVNAYASFARSAKLEKIKQLNNFTEQVNAINEVINRPQFQSLQENTNASNEEHVRQFEKELKERIKVTRQILTDSKELFDNQLKIKKLKDTIFAVNDQLSRAKKQGVLASLIAAKSTPKSLHCLSMRLLEERITNEEKYVEEQFSPRQLEDPNLYHCVIFSDSVIAVSVVVNSAARNSKHPEKLVFHVITDKSNLWAMKVWFKMSPPNNVSHVEVRRVEDFDVKQRFQSSWIQMTSLLSESDDLPNLVKFQSPKYLSMLNLRFYLPEMFSKLRRVLLLDDDVVVQKDLSALWKMDMEGKVNAAVELCSGSLHRYSSYMNFSHPLIQKRFDPNNCAWAYGMNMFDLDAWRKQKRTEEYHYWLSKNEDGSLWKYGTLPLGLFTFHKWTKALDKSWHLLGLGHDPNISTQKIKSAAVIHYNGNMKPWLDVALNHYRDYWTKYVDYGMVFIQMCNFGH